MGSEDPAPGRFLSMFRWDLPFRSFRNDSLKDFFKDFLLDMGLSSAFAMSKNAKSSMTTPIIILQQISILYLEHSMCTCCRWPCQR